MVYVPKEKRRKWDERSERCIFMGYIENSKAHRVDNFKLQDVAVRRDVIFLKEGQDTPKEEIPPKRHLSKWLRRMRWRLQRNRSLMDRKVICRCSVLKFEESEYTNKRLVDSELQLAVLHNQKTHNSW